MIVHNHLLDLTSLCKINLESCGHDLVRIILHTCSLYCHPLQNLYYCARVKKWTRLTRHFIGLLYHSWSPSMSQCSISPLPLYPSSFATLMVASRHSFSRLSGFIRLEVVLALKIICLCTRSIALCKTLFILLFWGVISISTFCVL